jgi:molybdopterin-guanine dinucleotide biosynthesis protein MobB
MAARIHIIGGKNQGKTTLICELVSEFRARGLRVGTIKHTHHHHELDTPGKDSHKHRQAGAAVVGILSPSMNAIFYPVDESASTVDDREDETKYESLVPAFHTCDLLLVEGDTRTNAPRLEVWRAALDTVPLANKNVQVAAIVTDDLLDTGARVLPRKNVTIVADFIWDIVKTRSA